MSVRLTPATVLDLQAQLRDGALIHPPDDRGRIDAYIPSLGDEHHAPNLALLPSGSLLCVWFAGSPEGTGDVSIGLSRLRADGGGWEGARFVTTSQDRSEQNPSLFLASSGDLWLLHTSQATRGMPRAEWDAWRSPGVRVPVGRGGRGRRDPRRLLVSRAPVQHVRPRDEGVDPVGGRPSVRGA